MKDNHFLRDLLHYLPSKIIPAIMGFVQVIILTHRLPPGGYGTYASILAFVKLLDAILFAWMRQSILRYYPEHRSQSKSREFDEKAFLILILVIGVECMGVLGWTLVEDSFTDTWLILLVLVPFTLFEYLATFYQSSRLARDYAIATLLQNGVQILLVLGFVYLARKDYPSALLAVGMGYLLGCLYLIVKAKRNGFSFRLIFRKVDWDFTKSLLGYGVPMSAWMLSFQLIFQANRLIINTLRSASEVGIYASTYDLVNGSLSLLMTPFLLASHPIVMQLWAQGHGRHEIEELLRHISRYLLLLCGPFLFLALLFGNKLFFILGEDYGVASWIVPVMVASAFLGQFSMYAHKGLEVASRTKTMLMIGLSTAILNVLLNLTFVGRYGYQASAVITLFSYLCYIVVVYRFSRHYLSLYIPWHSVLDILCAGMGATLCLILIRATVWAESAVSLLLAGLIFGMLYILILALLGELDREKRVLFSYVHSALSR